ncbi:hypothetical protein IMCC12053_626 [Celeribacter marinus]|uniref:Uncharacterized protein n=1 Tax=Celeribacter marinus TaxID=1397108 RepID=A0A0P0A9Q0_9RHOB|nr:hypothetical protein IMCC12053_626 [Celeribacter marinus]
MLSWYHMMPCMMIVNACAMAFSPRSDAEGAAEKARPIMIPG